MTREQTVSLISILKSVGVPDRISLEEVARRCGVNVFTDDLPKSIPGYAPKDSDSRFVVIGNALSPKEREWTLAHELAHVHFTIKDDKMADSFAAEVLFPKHVDELNEALKALPQGSSSDPLGLRRVVDAAVALYLLDRHLIDENKRKKARCLAESVAFAGAITLLACVVGYGIFLLIEHITTQRKAA